MDNSHIAGQECDRLAESYMLISCSVVRPQRHCDTTSGVCHGSVNVMFRRHGPRLWYFVVVGVVDGDGRW